MRIQPTPTPARADCGLLLLLSFFLWKNLAEFGANDLEKKAPAAFVTFLELFFSFSKKWT